MIIDWVSCSITKKPDVILAWLKGSLTGRWDSKNHAEGRHTKTLICGGVRIYTEALSDKSIRLMVSGQGCRELEQAGLASDWPDFLSTLLDAGARFTRLDVALDDKMGQLDMDTIFQHCDDGLLTSRCKHTNQNKGKDTAGGLEGKTATFGSRGSDTYLRIYSKSLKENVSFHWVRVELEARDRRAQALARDIVEHGAKVVPAVILGYIKFREPGSTSRRDRWPLASWWTDFLNTDKVFHLDVAPRDVTKDKTRHWLLHVVARTFARYYDAEGEAFLKEMLERGRRGNSG